MSSEETLKSINDKRYEDADGDLIWQQLGEQTRVAVQARDAVKLPDGVQFRIGSDLKPLRKIIVKLMSADFYVVELGHVSLTTREWVVDGHTYLVDHETLPDAVRGLVGEVIGYLQ